MPVQCMRCKQVVDSAKTRFVATVRKFDWGMGIEVVRPEGLNGECCAVHLIGDRECGPPVSGYIGEIVKKAGITDIKDIHGHYKL